MDFDGDYLNSRVSVPQKANIKVYTRRVLQNSHKTSINNNIATPISVGSENPNIISASIVTSSPDVPSTTGTEVATASDSRELNNSAVASISQTINVNCASTAEFRSDCIPNACVDVSATEHVGSCRQKLRMQSPIQETSVEEAKDSLLLKQFQQLVGLQHDEQSPLLAGDNALSQNGMLADTAYQPFEPQIVKRLSPPLDDEEVHYTNETRSCCLDDEQLMNGIDPQKLGKSSPLSSANNFPNGREKPPALLPSENHLRNDERSEVIPSAPELSENKPAVVNGEVESLVVTKVDDKVIFSFSKATKKDDIEQLRRKLKTELDQIRKVSDQLEVKERQLASYSTQVRVSNLNNRNSGVEECNVAGYFHPQTLVVSKNVVEGKELTRINSEMSGIGHQATVPMRFGRVNSDVGMSRNLEPRPYIRQLSVALTESPHDTGEIVDKEKRTPKANRYYRNSEFLLGKDKLPPESNKKLKKMNGRKHGSRTEQEHGFGFDKNKNQVLKSCSGLLQRLMKHKHAWVFNEPVDSKALGLHDYHVIIKHPMDLGTIKTRLSQNWYKSPREFAEDVRIVFINAMTYNPKGQDVHVMAEELSGVFEEKWAAMETKYNPYLKYHVYQDAGLPTPTSRKFPPLPHGTPASGPVSSTVSIRSFASTPASILSLTPSAPTTTNILMASESKLQRLHVGRMPALTKPKAKDPNKRDMTYEEKQRLSTNLQNLASEKLDAIVQIIKKNDTALSQHDDEIEVDIDSVDPETLWELDRFVINYRKGLSKKKRKAELALQARTDSNQSVPQMNPTTAAREVRSKSGTGNSLAEEDEKINISRSSSSSSSSSDSGSSSSGSESDNSSADGSGAG